MFRYLSKTELKAFVRDFEKTSDNYRKSVNSNIASMVIHPDLSTRMNSLKNFF